ncbi:hypothetical protein DPSP01_002904 [Paraphaeosphaeria sporulosa]
MGTQGDDTMGNAYGIFCLGRCLFCYLPLSVLYDSVSIVVLFYPPGMMFMHLCSYFGIVIIYRIMRLLKASPIDDPSASSNIIEMIKSTLLGWEKAPDDYWLSLRPRSRKSHTKNRWH